MIRGEASPSLRPAAESGAWAWGAAVLRYPSLDFAGTGWGAVIYWFIKWPM
jgi:hypothetical protein